MAMSSALINALMEQRGVPLVDEQTLDHFVSQQSHTLLFFTENPQQFPESNDVAVVIPLLMDAFGDRFQVAVVARDAEHQLHARFPFDGWPSLVLLKDGAYVGAISKMQDWDVYQAEIERLLSAEPASIKPINIPVVSADSHCH
jgi:hydrogenase-1 operon protein HyaE